MDYWRCGLLRWNSLGGTALFVNALVDLFEEFLSHDFSEVFFVEVFCGDLLVLFHSFDEESFECLQTGANRSRKRNNQFGGYPCLQGLVVRLLFFDWPQKSAFHQRCKSDRI